MLAFVVGILSVEIFHVGLSFAKSVLLLLIISTANAVFSFLITHPKRVLIEEPLQKRGDWRRFSTTIFIGLGSLLFGLLWAFVYEWSMRPSLDPAFLMNDDDGSEGRPFIGYGQIISPPDVDGQTVKLIVQMKGVRWDVQAERDDRDQWIVPLPSAYAMARHEPARWSEMVSQLERGRPSLHPSTIWVRLKLSSSEEKVLAKTMIAGDTIVFTGLLQSRTAFHPLTPGGFDFSRYLWEEGIEYVADAQFANVMIVKRGPFWNAWKASFIDQVRTAYAFAPASVRSLALAIVFGDKREISGEMRDAFQNAGVYHLLIVSGIHFAILTGAFYALLGFFGLSSSQRGIWVLMFLVGYAWLAHGSVAVARAAWMGGIYWTGRLFNLRFTPWLAFSIPLIVSLLMNPRQLFALGFLMTFVLTAALMRYTPSLRQWIMQFTHEIRQNMYHPALKKIASFVGSSGASSFLAMLVLTELLSMVFVLTFFKFWPGLTPLANALLLPFYTLVLPLVAVLSLIGGGFAWLGDELAPWIVLPGAYALWLIEQVVMYFADIGRFLRISIQGSSLLWALVTTSALMMMLEIMHRRVSWQSLLPLYPGPPWLNHTIAFKRPLRSIMIMILGLAVLFVPVFIKTQAGVQKTGVFFVPTTSVRLVGILFPGKEAVLIVEDAPLEELPEPWRRARHTVSDMQTYVVPTLVSLGVNRIKALMVPEMSLTAASPVALRKYSPLASLCRTMNVEKVYVVPAAEAVDRARKGSGRVFSDRQKEALQALCPSSTPVWWLPNTALIHDDVHLTLTFPEPQEPWLKRVPVWTLNSKTIAATFRAGAAMIQKANGQNHYIDYRPRNDDVSPWYAMDPPQNVYAVAPKGFIWIDLQNAQ